MSDVTWSDIKESLRFEEVLDDLDIDLRGVRGSNKGWFNVGCPLPSHPSRDENPSFGVNLDSMSFNCFTCNEQGNVVSLVMIMNELELEDAMAYLAKFADVEIDRDEEFIESIDRTLDSKGIQITRQRRAELPYFDPAALDDLPYASPKILDKWQITDLAAIKAFGLRYDKARRRRVADYTGSALVIPHYIDGQLVGWQERWLDEDRPKNVPKYTNTSNFPRQETVFNQDRARWELNAVIVVESVMTAIRLHQLGYTAVATFGASVTPEQRRVLASYPTIVLAYDNDPDFVNEQGKLIKGAGIRAIKDLSVYLSDYTDVYVIDFPPGEKADLADLKDDLCKHLIEKACPALELI